MTIRWSAITHVLLDFDGPIAGMFAGGLGPRIATDLWHQLDGRDDQPTPSEDPFDILRAAAERSRSIAAHVETALSHLETLAAENAPATPHAAEVVTAAHDTNRPVAIVSNNAEPAIRRYLDIHGIRADEVIGRAGPDPALLKPSPYLVNDALRRLSARPEAAVLVGDSMTDVEAAHAAGVLAIGYANKPGKAERFAAIHADDIITSMAELIPAMTAAPV